MHWLSKRLGTKSRITYFLCSKQNKGPKRHLHLKIGDKLRQAISDESSSQKCKALYLPFTVLGFHCLHSMHPTHAKAQHKRKKRGAPLQAKDTFPNGITAKWFLRERGTLIARIYARMGCRLRSSQLLLWLLTKLFNCLVMILTYRYFIRQWDLH